MGALVNPWFHTQNRTFPAWEPKEAKKMWFLCLNHCVFVLVGHQGCAIKSNNISGESETSVYGDFDRSEIQNIAFKALFWKSERSKSPPTLLFDSPDIFCDIIAQSRCPTNTKTHWFKHKNHIFLVSLGSHGGNMWFWVWNHGFTKAPICLSNWL